MWNVECLPNVLELLYLAVAILFSTLLSMASLISLSYCIGTPTNVRTTNVGHDKRQNDKRQKGQM